MSKMRTPDEPGPFLPGQATEIQSPDGLNLSVDLSIPKHVTQHEAAPDVAGYVLTARLGEGAYGQVWRAWQIRTRKEVAVKVFKQHSGLDWIFLQREVERLLRLDRHPHVVTLLDAGLESDPPFYVVDLLTGGSLDQFVDPQKEPPRRTRAMAWTRQNVRRPELRAQQGSDPLRSEAGQRADRRAGSGAGGGLGQSRVFTESAASLGTLFYMAPEQAVVTELGKPVHPDVRWDIYALGATLFSMLTGRVPYATAANREALETGGLAGQTSGALSCDDRRPVGGSR
jgi:serine/threonine protein kinase